MSTDASLARVQLAQRTGLAPPSVTGLITRLETKGYVRRTKDPDDGRRILVEVRPEVSARFAHLFAPFGKALDRLYAEYTDDELAIILDYSTRAAELQRKATHELVEQPAPPLRRR